MSSSACDIIPVVILALITLSFVRTSSGDRCGIAMCLKDFEKIVKTSNLAFAQNEEQLDSLCRHLNQTLTCVNDFITHCVDGDLRSHFAGQFSGTLILIDKLCKRHSPFRTKFLKHAHCYAGLAEDYNKCNSEFHEQEKLLYEEAASNVNLTLQVEKWCCIFDLHRTCTKHSVESACGEEAAQIADQLTVVTAGESAKVYCSNLTAASIACSRHIASSSPCHLMSNQSPNKVSVLLLVILLLLNSI